MGKFKLKDQLAGIAALIAAIVAIGGGFVKYGEIMTKLDVLSEQSGPDLHILHSKLVTIRKIFLKIFQVFLIILNQMQYWKKKLNY